MSEYRVLPLRSIRPHPVNPRFDLGDLTELTEDIRDAGLIEPLVVAPGSHGKAKGACRDCDQPVDRLTSGVLVEHLDGSMPCPGGSEPAGDEWFLLAGHRRHAASLAAGLWEAPCVTRFDVKTPADALVVMVRENGHRRDLTPLEEAHAYEQLALFGMTPTKIAQRTHRSKKVVDRRLALNALTDGAKAKLKAGVMTLADAEALLNLTPERAERALRSVGTKEFRQEVAREHLGGDADAHAVAGRLREEFLAPYLTGAARPSTGQGDRVLRETVAALADNLPRAVVRAWMHAVGVGESIELSTIPALRALIGLAVTVEKNPVGTYDLLHALGYEPSPVEIELLEAAG